VDLLILPESAGIPQVEDILGHMDAPPTPEGADLIRRAYDFARRSHDGQFRKSGEPYFSHCARVGWLLAGTVNDPSTVAAGLLHDTVEDCGVGVDKLNLLFGETVASLVDGVTKISALRFSTDQEHQVENLRKMFLATARDIRVVLIKLFDRLHNMQTLEFLPPARQRAIAQSTLDVFAPLANRLGMARVRALLEDLSMKYLHPQAYRELMEKIAGRRDFDQRIVDSSRELLQKRLEEQHIPAEVQGRSKHLYSIHQKLLRQGMTFEEVYDILGVRIVTDTIQECYEILGVVHTIWKPISGRFKDYIASPKENGYQSIHTTVIGVESQITEVQIRTRRMHRIAEEGIAAHWKYKESGSETAVRAADEKRLNWLRQLVDWLKDVRDPSDFVDDLKRDVFQDTVFCYTPAGDIMEMPRGATGLDLAFRIHTQLGFTCSGARINGRMASIRTVIQTGDVVEILTSKSAHPTLDWLQFARTGRARNKIRGWLKANRHDEFLERGRRMLFEQVRARFDSTVDETRIVEILTPSFKQLQVESFNDLLVEVGCGTVKLSSVLGRIEQVTRPPTQRRLPRHTRRPRRGGDAVLVDGMDGAVVRMAGCCSPLPGDPIVGFITQGRGISVHKENCRSLANIRRRTPDFDNRTAPVEWGGAGRNLQKVAIRLMCNDRKGLLSDVSAAITQLGINITATESNSNLRENRAIIKIQILVESVDQLNSILNRLASVPGVQSLSRVVHGN
jgi:GTP pyrophosphokinase